MISIHPPREGWDYLPVRCSCFKLISIHPPREGWDQPRQRYRRRVRHISIHPPREGWDGQKLIEQKGQNHISIHPPREGWDRIAKATQPKFANFNPPTP